MGTASWRKGSARDRVGITGNCSSVQREEGSGRLAGQGRLGEPFFS